MFSTNAPARAVRIALALLAAVVMAGCASLSEMVPERPAPQTEEDPELTSAHGDASGEEAETIFASQFTIDGTFQSHIEIDGIDFVYTVWPTKATPLTNEWYPRGSKYFSFTLTAYDLERDLRDPFDTKRRVWLDRIEVTSRTQTTSGTVERPYELDARASRITFDPEPQTSRRGMLITSPKGAFEVRNQEIGDLAADTEGLTLVFEATVQIQRSRGSSRYDTEIIRQEVPIRIFPSDTPTVAQEIPFTAN